MAAENNLSLVNAKSYLDNLDLSYVTNRMCSERYELPIWPRDLAIVCEKLYKRFLWLLVKYNDKNLVPTRDIDEFWHNHILYTKEYMADCVALCGSYLHHSPAEPDNPVEAEALVDLFLLTQELYQDEFDESLEILDREII